MAAHSKPYFGSPDNSCVANSIVAMTEQSVALWNPAAGVEQGLDAVDVALADRALHPALTGVEGLVQKRWTGDSFRCFLKLAGTPYWPGLKGKAPVVESLGRSSLSLATSLARHMRIGSFGAIAGIVVGQLAEVDRAGECAAVLELAGEYVGGLSIAKTPGLGYSPGSESVTFS